MIDKNYKAGTQKGSANYDAVITLIATPKGKFPPQAGKIIEALVAAKGNTLTVGELVGTDGSTESALDKAGLFEKTGILPTDMGYAIKSNMIKKVFKHKKSSQTKKTKYSKAVIYEKMLPSVVLVVVSIPESKWISKKPKK